MQHCNSIGHGATVETGGADYGFSQDIEVSCLESKKLTAFLTPNLGSKHKFNSQNYNLT